MHGVFILIHLTTTTTTKKPPPPPPKKHHRHHQKTTTTQCKLLERKYGICASGWKEKHHQRKLQWVKPPRVHNAAIIVTCVRVYNSNFLYRTWKKFELCTFTQVTMIAALCTRGGFTHCNLRWWCFSFHPLAQIPYLCSSNLHCGVDTVYSASYNILH